MNLQKSVMKKKYKKRSRPSKVSTGRPVRGTDYGKIKFRTIDYLSVLITLITTLVCVVLVGLSNHFGFDETWYGDILTMLVSIICFFGLMNLFYLFRSGITVENGRCFLGIDANKKPIFFDREELHSIRLIGADGDPINEEAKRYFRVRLEFLLKDGSLKVYETNWISHKVYRAIRTYFDA